MTLDYWTLYEAPPDSPKKWVVRVPTASGRGKEVAFGARGYEDFTTHHDVERRERYRTRHQRDRLDDPYAAGFWSWWALWGESDDLDTAFADAVSRAKEILGEIALPRKNPIRIKPAKEVQVYPVRPKIAGKYHYHGFLESPEDVGRRVLDIPVGEQPWFLGTIVNPRTMRPYFAAAADTDGTFIIFVPTFDLTAVEIVGRGWLEADANSPYAASALETGMPRIHADRALPTEEQGTGLGTVLYTAGALLGSYLAAHLQDGEAWNFPGVQDNKAFPQESGVSSGYGANTNAKEWWNKAVERGLARRAGAYYYAYPAARAVSEGLVLDLTPTLRSEVFPPNIEDDEWLHGFSRQRAARTILNLDLREVDDLDALRYFQRLAEDAGATAAQQRRFAQRVAQYHQQQPTALYGMDDPDDALRVAGYRVNPDDTYARAAQVIYGDLSSL